MGDNESMWQNGMDEMRIDRTALTVLCPTSGDTAYWETRPVGERMAHIERLRRACHGTAACGRLQRVFEVIVRPPR